MSVACWRCGAGLALDPADPVARGEACVTCGADVRSCRGCAFYDVDAADACREPAAERVVDKEMANFCGWYRLATGRAGDAAAVDPAAEAKRRLEALFGPAGKKP